MPLRVFDERSCFAHIGFARFLLAVSFAAQKGYEKPTSRLSHDRPILCKQHRNVLSQASAPLQGMTDAAPPPRPYPFQREPHGLLPIRTNLATPSGGLVPFSVFPLTSSDLIPTVPNVSVRRRSQAFATSQRFFPLASCQAYSILVPLLGFPFEALILHRCRTPSRNAGSLRVEP